MKLFTAFKTPSWEQRDPERRALAVRDDTAPELLAKLAEIAANDAEPMVRRAALSRLSAVSVLLERHRADADAETRAAALARLQKVVLDPTAGLAPGARLAAIALDLPSDLLERVAEAAPEVEARRAALTRTVRPGFLQRRCVEEVDANLRAELLERIEGEDALERLAEQLRKRDKTLARRARDRAEALRLGRGDSGALQRFATQLCETLTQWAQQQPDDVETRVVAARAEWEARADAFDAAMRLRIEAYFERVREAQSRRVQRVVEAETAAIESAASEALAVEASAAAPAKPLRAPTDWTEFDRLLADANRAAAAKHLGEARPALQALRGVMGALPKPDRARRERLDEVEARVEELEQWQRWSGNRARARLCDEVEALIAAAPHPDAVANRVRELQSEWAKVEAAEPGDAEENRGAGLARRFRALCARAMAPTKPYFEQRQALRDQRRDALEALLAQTAPEALASHTAPALVGLRRKLVEALRTLDELDPKARTRLARALREALTRIDAALDTQREDAALTRRKLIARLRRELTHADPSTALDLARQAQLEWKSLPRPAREHEAALEHELAALIEPLFARERAQRDTATQESARRASESQRMLDELAALATADAEALAHAEGRIAALSASWRELHATAAPDREPSRFTKPPSGRDRDARGRTENPRRDANPRRETRGGQAYSGREARGAQAGREARPERAPRATDAERRFDQAVAKVRQAQQALEVSRRGASLKALADAATLFSAVERGTVDATTAEAQWQTLPLEETVRRRLGARWEQAKAGRAPIASDAASARATWLVDAELDTGIDSPADAQPLRRQAQMQRLATRLQGAQAAAADPRERLLQWALLGGEFRAVDATRLSRIVAAWSGETLSPSR